MHGWVVQVALVIVKHSTISTLHSISLPHYYHSLFLKSSSTIKYQIHPCILFNVSNEVGTLTFVLWKAAQLCCCCHTTYVLTGWLTSRCARYLLIRLSNIGNCLVHVDAYFFCKSIKSESFLASAAAYFHISLIIIHIIQRLQNIFICKQ